MGRKDPNERQDEGGQPAFTILVSARVVVSSPLSRRAAAIAVLALTTAAIAPAVLR